MFSLSLSCHCRFVDIDTGIIGDTFPTRAASANGHRITLQRGNGYLGALHLLIRALHRMVSMRTEILQGQE